ncbi:hypothetical protein J5A51_02430 [Prevotella fusca JCM 17724]|uniref:Lipoprotein n=2 Tax=Prevotella fusca TaxID=589436 RepID=A0A0K1NN61_9BACT|nr:hypothetical protein ADJ77_12195 [Prevotella fusca JCM 17724]QUB86139.1 hypothetical protein J5A51_02430 [Prevotella fusca JCM 17724]
MKRFLLFLLTVTFMLSSSCTAQKNKVPQKQKSPQWKTIKKSEVDLIKKYDHEIRDYYREIYDIGLDGIIAMSNKDQVKYTDIAVELMCHALYRYGFKSVDSITAANAIRKYYGVDINRTASLSENGFHKFVFPGGDAKERVRQSKMLSDGYTFFNNTIFIPKDNLLLYAPVIDNVVELKGYLYEDEVPDSVFKKGRITYSLEKSIFYVNQFIFHDSKAALTWLMNNDRNFLRELFLKYGYDKSDIINKMMIDEVKEEGELPIGKEYKELFVSKGADGRLLIHQGLLQYMLKHADRKNLYYCMLDQYLSYLLDMENEPEFDNLTKEERYKAGAYIGYYYGLMYEKCIGTPCDIQAFGYRLYYQKDFISYIKKNNYFQLKDFDKIIQIQYDRYQEGVEIESHRMSGE